MHFPTFLVGLLMAAIGIMVSYFTVKSKKSCTAKTVGTVIGHRTVRVRGSSGANYYEDVAFSVNGIEYKCKRKAGLSGDRNFKGEFKAGEELTVLYDPANPKKSRLEVDDKIDKIPILGPFIAIVGIGIIIFAFFI